MDIKPDLQDEPSWPVDLPPNAIEVAVPGPARSVQDWLDALGGGPYPWDDVLTPLD